MDKHGDADATVMRIRVGDGVPIRPCETPNSEGSEAFDYFATATLLVHDRPLPQNNTRMAYSPQMAGSPRDLPSPGIVRRSVSLSDLRPLPRPINTEVESIQDELMPGAAQGTVTSPRLLQSVTPPLASPSPRILPHRPA